MQNLKGRKKSFQETSLTMVRYSELSTRNLIKQIEKWVLRDLGMILKELMISKIA